MDVKLIVVGGETKTTEVNLKLPTVIGRGKEASLTLPHPLVSRQHTEIYETDGKLFVRDLGSLNGTFVNNERIEGEHELPPGNLLTVGTVTFRAVYNGIEAASVGAKKTTAGKLTDGGTVVATQSMTIQADADDTSKSDTAGPSSATDGEEVEFADFDIGSDETENIDNQLPTPTVDSDTTASKDDDDLNSFLSGLD